MLKQDKPLINVKSIEKPIPTPKGMKKIFASYNFVINENGQMGFGNTVSIFDPEAYGDGNIEKWVLDLQKSIEMALEDTLGKKTTARVLFFR